MSDFVVLVGRPYTTTPPLRVTLRTDANFDGTGVVTRSGANIDFTVIGAGAALTFNGVDNSIPGATLAAGVDLLAVATAPSAAMNDFVLTLTLNGGSRINGPPTTHRFTAVQATLDICEPRIDDATDPVPLPTANAAAAGVAIDKFYLGRPVPVQTKPKIDERATLIVRDIRPAGFTGNLELRLDPADNGQIKIFKKEKPAKDKALSMPMRISPSKVGPNGLKLFVEGAVASPGARGTGLILGVRRVAGELDHVKVTVCHTEIVSNRTAANIPTVAKVPELPARTTNSPNFLVAPIIVGLEYPVEMRPYIETAVPNAYLWSTPSARVTLTNAATEVLGLRATTLSGALNDVPLEVLLTTDIGKLKKKHLLTCVSVEMDPVSTGDKIKHGDPLNRIKNPSGCVILGGADSSNAKLVPRYKITEIEPDLKWKKNDKRIAWWILGGQAPANNQYDGSADFRNTEASKRGTKIQAFGTAAGDILIQPYSGGYGYGMIRARVVPIRQVKYRINRIFTKAQKAKPLVPAIPAQAMVPAQAAVSSFSGAPGNPALPSVPAMPMVPALAQVPAVPAVPSRTAHGPTKSHAEAALHMKIVNIYLRPVGIEMIPDNSGEVARPVIAGRAAQPAVKAQAAIGAQPAIPALGGAPPRPLVPMRPNVPARPAVPAIVASAANPAVGLPALDNTVVRVTQVSPGHFDVEVNDVAFAFNSGANQIPAIQINARNEVISFAYIENDPGGNLAIALRCPANHAPLTSARQPEVYTTAAFTLPDLSSPSTSLVPPDGIPPNTPPGQVNMIVLFPDVNWQPVSPAVRDIDLLWGIVVPTRNIDASAGGILNIDKRRRAYGNTLAHEMGHILGLGHRGDLTNPVTDGIVVPAQRNMMHPSAPPPGAENFDIIQTKAIRFSEVMNRNP